MAKTTDAIEILNKRDRQDLEAQRYLEEARLCGDVAQLIHDARTAAGLTQAQLADLVGTSQSAISRLEDADYEGHSLSIIQRIAKGLGLRVNISFSSDADQHAA